MGGGFDSSLGDLDFAGSEEQSNESFLYPVRSLSLVSACSAAVRAENDLCPHTVAGDNTEAAGAVCLTLSTAAAPPPLLSPSSPTCPSPSSWPA